MKVKFTTACEIDIHETEEIFTTEVFNPGDTADFDIIDHPLRFDGKNFVPDPNLVNVQFGDGTVALGLDKAWFEVISED